MVSFSTELRSDYRSQLLEEIPSYFDFAKSMILPEGKSRGRAMIVPEDAPEPNHPAQLCILAALDEGFDQISIAKPVRDGGTQVSLVPLFRRAIKERQRALLGYPTMDSSKDIWTTKVQPTLDAYGGQEILQGGGSRGGAARLVKLPGGGEFMLRSAGGRGQSGQAAVHGDLILLDELDDWRDEETILNMIKRVVDSPSILVILISTVKKDAGSRILERLRLGTNTHLEFPCVHCGALQRLTWERVNLVNATYRCLHCPAEWSERDRRQSLRKWKRVDKNPGAKAFSIIWTCLDSPLVTLYNEIHGTAALPGYLSAVQHIDMLGDHSEMRSFTRDRLGEIYVKDIQDEEGGDDEFDAGTLSKRSMAHGWAVPVVDLHPEKLWSRYVTDTPVDADAAICCIDVQGDRLYWSCVAFKFLGTIWHIAWGQERCRMRQVGETLEPEPWGPGDLIQTLDRTADFLAELTHVPLIHRLVDTRYEGRELAQWLGTHRQWRGVIGHAVLPKIDPESEQTFQVMMLPNLLSYDRQWITRVGRFQIVTEAARANVHDGLKKSPEEPGAILLPKGLPRSDHYLRHLTSWLLKTDAKTKKTRWEKQQKRDDHLDTSTYIQALVQFENERRLRAMSNPAT